MLVYGSETMKRERAIQHTRSSSERFAHIISYTQELRICPVIYANRQVTSPDHGLCVHVWTLLRVKDGLKICRSQTQLDETEIQSSRLTLPLINNKKKVSVACRCDLFFLHVA